MLDANTFYTGLYWVMCYLVSIASSVSLTRMSTSHCPVSETACVASAKYKLGSLPKDCGTELAAVPATFINVRQQRSF
jgi:hypothetical protein